MGWGFTDHSWLQNKGSEEVVISPEVKRSHRLHSGGYAVSKLVREVRVETLVLRGRQDEILEGKYAEAFARELPGAKLTYIEKCGHPPHLECAGTVRSTSWTLFSSDL